MTSPSIPLRSWIVLLSIGVLIFILNIDYTAVNLVLLPVSEEIHADLNDLQWLLSAYVLVWAAFVIPAGRIADLYGKCNTLIAGLSIFMLGSVLAGLGQSIEVLILGRVLQGFGAAIFTAPAWALIFTTAPHERQGFVMGIILSFSGFGLAAGPTLAGIIIQELSWRWIFYINIPLSILVILALKLYAAKENLPKVQHSIDILSVLLFASGLCIFMYGLNEIEGQGLNKIYMWVGLALGVLLMGGFVFRDRLQKMRMIPPHLFRNKLFMAATMGEFFMSMNFSMTLVLMGLYLQNTLNYSSYETGLIFISMTISMGFLSPIGGKLIDLCGLKVPMTLGALLTASGMGLMVFLGVASSLLHVVTALFLVGTGLGIYFAACNLAMMRAVPADTLNVASGVYTMFMMIGNTLSVILATSFVVIFGSKYLFNMTLNEGMLLSSQQHQTLVDVISKVDHSADQLKDFPAEQVPQLLRLIDQAFVFGMSLNMIAGTLFALMAVGLTLWGVRALDKHTAQKHALPIM